MKLLLLSSTLLILSCSPKFGHIQSKSKFSKWMVVEKYESDTGCVYYWDQGMKYFTAPCNLYEVGDTIRHY